MQKVLIIGNGSSVLTHTYGEEIDNFDGKIVRFNTYHIDTFERFVGTRTDIWITCSSHPMWWKDYEKVYLVCYARNRDDSLLTALRKRYPTCENIPEWAWKFTANEMNFSAMSSGALAVGFFQKDYEVYIYGIDFFASNKHHYGDDINFCYHNSQKEMEYFRKLMVAGKVKPYKDYLKDMNYEILHNVYPSYGIGGNWFMPKIKEIAKQNNVKTILDYGCGKGSLVKLLNKNGFECFGYDLYVEEYSELPFCNVDMVVSTDVFEHLDEMNIDNTLYDIELLSPKFQFHAISNRKASMILPDGSNAHVTVKPPEWWANKLNAEILEHNDKNNFTTYFIDNSCR